MNSQNTNKQACVIKTKTFAHNDNAFEMSICGYTCCGGIHFHYQNVG